MSVPFDSFTDSFLQKIKEFDLANLYYADAQETVDGYMKRALQAFKKNCKYDFITTADYEDRSFNIDVKEEDLDEIVDIVSEGMVVQWMKPYVYRQEILENAISTKDFSVYSPAEMLLRVGNAYKTAKQDYSNMISEYSYNHNNLRELHI